jgi:hypothetical protein
MQSLCQTHEVALIQKALIDPGRHHALDPLSELHQKPQKQAMETPNGCRPTQSRHSQEIPELWMEIGEDRRRVTRCPLPATERPRLNTVVMNSTRPGLVADAKPVGGGPVGELDILPRCGREILSKTAASFKLASR